MLDHNCKKQIENGTAKMRKCLTKFSRIVECGAEIGVPRCKSKTASSYGDIVIHKTASSAGEKEKDLAAESKGEPSKQSTNPFDSSSEGGGEANRQVKDMASLFTNMLKKIDERGGQPNRSWDLCVEGYVFSTSELERIF